MAFLLPIFELRLKVLVICDVEVTALQATDMRHITR